jgi:hypothetical protein
MQLHRDRERFDEAGARLVVVGQGEPEDAARFRDRFHVEGLEVLVDAEREAYARAGTKIGGLRDLYSFRSVTQGIAISARHRMLQGRTVGDAGQLGAVLVVAPDGRVAWSHIAEDPADNPPVDEVLDAARSATGAGAGDRAGG